ncbi:MAG: glycine--tRNA ligase subunit beta [Pseudomonadota bacterium]
MPSEDLLIEIGTEELPPRLLMATAASFAERLSTALDNAHLGNDSVVYYATPRRLAVIIRNLVDTQPEQHETRRGPAVAAAYDEDGQPTKAALGFARSCGVDVTQLGRLETNKGQWLQYEAIRPGSPMTELIGDLVNEAISGVTIERAMRWGSQRTEFIRPVHWVSLIYGSDVIEAEILGLPSGDDSRGHRFMDNGAFSLAPASSYLETLRSHYVIADHKERRATIEQQLQQVAKELEGDVVTDPKLLDEVTALVEWPVTLAGRFDSDFLSVPAEVLISAMKKHQRYFHVEDQNGALMPVFLFVANLESTNPQTVVAGNERVISPRLADARFFYQQDQKTSLASRLSRLEKVVFQSELGSYEAKAHRIAAFAAHIARSLGQDPDLAHRAGLLCKCDLVTDMVDEFPDLQGVMGGYYASSDGESAEVGQAIAEHYLPIQSGGNLPESPLGACVSIADKLDTLVGLFGIGQPPSGSRDPFALRRQALGAMRICIERGLRLDIRDLVSYACQVFDGDTNITFEVSGDALVNAILDYMIERLEVAYTDRGMPVEVFRALRGSMSFTTDLHALDARLSALQSFQTHGSARAIVAGNKRVTNILRDSAGEHGPIDQNLLTEPAELTLVSEINRVSDRLRTSSYDDSFTLIAEIQPSIDQYFEAVMVMTDDSKLRENRLSTLHHLKSLYLAVADFAALQW